MNEMQFVKGMQAYDQNFTAAANKLIERLRRVAARSGYPEYKFPVLEHYAGGLEELLCGERGYWFVDRKNRKLNLSSDSLIALLKYLKVTGLERFPPPALSFLHNVFRHRSKRYRSFHHYCVYEFGRMQELESIIRLLHYVRDFSAGFNAGRFRIRFLDFALFADLLRGHLDGVETKALLYNFRFQEAEYKAALRQLPPGVADGLERLLHAAPVSASAFRPAEFGASAQYQSRFQDVLSKLRDNGFGEAEVSFDKVNMSLLGNGLYFYVEDLPGGKVIADGGSMLVEGLPEGYGCYGLAFGVEQMVHVYSDLLHEDSYYIYLLSREEEVIHALDVFLKRIGDKVHCVDSSATGIKQALTRAAMNGYTAFIPFGRAEAVAGPSVYKKESNHSYSKTGHPFHGA